MHRARRVFEHLRRMAVAYAVLLVALVLTFLAYHYVRQDVEDAARYRFSETVLAARSAIENQMGSYVDAMFGARAHFYASNSVEMEEWGGYANGIDLTGRYEGMRVMGYAKRVEPEDRDEFVEELSQTYDGAGLSEPEMQALINAGAVDLVEDTVAAGAPVDAARKWWLGELARHANERGTDVASLPMTPVQVARLVALVDAGTLNDTLARQVIEAVLGGEGDPDEVVANRGLAVVSDDSALLAAVDEALAANPDVAQKIRGGKVAAAGAIVGAVMKVTRGQADAARVRELVLERCAAGG